MRSKRPWKKHARIERVETNGGDVKYVTSLRSFYLTDTGVREKDAKTRGKFESLHEAEADLDAWWSEWWPAQTKSVRRA